MKNGILREILHNQTLTFYEISQQLANYYDLDNFVFDSINFMYEGYGERGGDKKSKILSEDGRIEDHWFKDNRIARGREINFSDLELQAEIKEGGEGDQKKNVIPSSCLE